MKKITTDYFCDDCTNKILYDNPGHNEYNLEYFDKNVEGIVQHQTIHLCRRCLLERLLRWFFERLLSHSFSIIEDRLCPNCTNGEIKEYPGSSTQIRVKCSKCNGKGILPLVK